VTLIQGAKKELLVENEEMSDQEIVAALERRRSAASTCRSA